MLNENALINENHKIVYHVANKYKKYKNVYYVDLVGEGNIALVKAIRTFNPDKGYKLSTYAYKCVKNAINTYIKTTKKHDKVMSVEFEKENENSVYDFLEADDNTLTNLENKESRQNILNVIKSIIPTLTHRQKQIFFLLYVKNLNDVKTAEILQITKEAVRQVRVAIKNKLKNKL